MSTTPDEGPQPTIIPPITDVPQPSQDEYDPTWSVHEGEDDDDDAHQD